jgi:hypothetical protein
MSEQANELKRKTEKTERSAATNKSAPKALPRLPGTITATSWTPPRRALSTDEWMRCGKALGGIASMTRWAVADWWSYGQHRYGERVQALKLEDTGIDLSLGTLMNMGVVSRAIETSRRNEVLSFGHHVCVTPLPPEQQDHWLARAESENLTVHALRAAIAQANGDSIESHGADSAAALPDEQEPDAPPPPPPLPPLPPVKRVDSDRSKLTTFNIGAAALVGLLREPPRLFAGTRVPPSHLRMIAQFVGRVAAVVDGTDEGT